MEWQRGFNPILITLIYLMHTVSGQICDDANIDFTDVKERTVTLVLPDEAATLFITPYPCNDDPAGAYYGCHCDEDDQLILEQDLQGSDSPYTVDYLFAGRQYEFRITNSADSTIACGGTYTVPKQPSAFIFDDQVLPNPTINAIGVAVQVPIVLNDSQCDPERHTEISNRFVLIAGSIPENITSDTYDPTGYFNFSIDGFEPGQEYTLFIQTTSGDMPSEEYPYSEEGGKFKTALHSVTTLGRNTDEDGYDVVTWIFAEGPRDGYLIKWSTTTPSDISDSDIEKNYHRYNLRDLYPGYIYKVSVETYAEGYLQQDPPPVDLYTIEPRPVSSIDIKEVGTSSVDISWMPPDDNFEYMYNITVKGSPCNEEDHGFCKCPDYGNAVHSTSNLTYIVMDLYSGRQYSINMEVVTSGPIASKPLDVPIILHTVTRPPNSVQIGDGGSTNTSIPISIQRTRDDCSRATEVHGYDISYRLHGKTEWTNDTFIDGSDEEYVSYNIDGLAPGEQYESCTNTIGSDQSKSERMCIDDMKTRINAPVIRTIMQDEMLSIRVTWESVEGDIDGYEVRCESLQGVNKTQQLNPNATIGECEDITPGALYSVTVDSLKDGYEQYIENTENNELLRPTPIKPTFTLDVINTSSINVSWDITGHLDRIIYMIDNAQEAEVMASEGHIVLSENLFPNEVYNISVWGVAGKNGDTDLETQTEAESAHFQMYSAEVGNLTIHSENASTIEIAWSNPPDNVVDTGLNHYIVQLWFLGKCARTIVMNNTELSQINEIDGLCGSVDYETFTGSSIILSLYDVEPCTNYTVMVIPVNTVGNGMESSELTETEFIGPMEPVDISVVSITATEISLKWNRPEPKNCPMSSHVTVSYVVCEDGELSEKETDDVYEIKLDDLQPFTNHTFTVNVFNKGGLMNDSTIVQTLSSAPGQPQGLNVTGITHNSAIFNWQQVHKCEENGIIVDYLLSVCPGDLQETCKTREIKDGTSFTLTELDPYTQHTYTLKARNGHDGDPIPGSFSTEMYNPEQPGIESVANCDGITITIVAPEKINGPLDGYRIEMWKQGDDQDKNTWSCNMDNCDKYGNPNTQLIINEDDFDDTVDLSQDDVYIAECIIKNTQFESEPVQSSISVDGCNGSDPDVGLIVGLTFMGIAIIIIVLGLIYARKKKLGPFRESDDGFSYLEGESMEAVSVGNGNTSNNHAVAGTANAAFSREDDIEVVESSRPIQIDQFEAYCNDSYEDSRYQMAEQFGVIKKQSPVYEGIECRRPENKPKNRYTNILPFDWSLVKLKTRVGVPYSEYINATYIPGERGKDEYIATQGPVTETVDDFWRMVWEQDTPIVIMLTVFVQNNKAKCVMYWPEAGSTMVCGDILVTTKSSDSWGYDDQYRTREIHLKCNDQVRVITQYQMVEWPDYGCPDSPDELLDLVETVRQQCPDDIMTRLVVHCSAGVGRTGTYIAVDRLRQQLDNKEPTDTIDIQAMISEMREYRPHMVQTEAQYTYIHECVNAMLLRKHGQNVDNGEVDIYENTDYPRKVSAESADSDNPTMSGAMPYPIKVSADSTDSDKPTMSGTMSMSVIV